MDRDQAEARAARIRAFRDELDELAGGGVLTLDEATAARVRAHHDAVLAALAARFDVARTAAGHTLGWGQRLVGALTATTLLIALVLLFVRVWGHLSLVPMAAILTATPLLLLAATAVTDRRLGDAPLTNFLGLLTTGVFTADLLLLGDLFSLAPSPHLALAVTLVAAILAWTFDAALLAALAAGGLVYWVAVARDAWQRFSWGEPSERLESWALGGLVALAASVVLERLEGPRGPAPPRRRGVAAPRCLAANARFWGAAAALFAVFLLGRSGDWSDLPWSNGVTETSYQVVGLLAGAAALAWGIRRDHPALARLASVALTVMLCAKVYDWCWDWMPRYLFFLAMGGIGLGVLFGLRALRRRLEPEVAR